MSCYKSENKFYSYKYKIRNITIMNVHMHAHSSNSLPYLEGGKKKKKNCNFYKYHIFHNLKTTLNIGKVLFEKLQYVALRIHI